MSDIMLIGLLLAFVSTGMILLRALAARRVHVRQARLKQHLDWMRPAARTGRRRRAFRR